MESAENIQFLEDSHEQRQAEVSDCGRAVHEQPTVFAAHLRRPHAQPPIGPFHQRQPVGTKGQQEPDGSSSDME